MTIQLLDGSILLDDGSITNHENCCCGCSCDNCSGPVPDQVQIDLAKCASTITTCENCPDFWNGTSFIADCLPDTDCTWRYREDPYNCGASIGFPPCAGAARRVFDFLVYWDGANDLYCDLWLYNCIVGNPDDAAPVLIAKWKEVFAGEQTCILQGGTALTTQILGQNSICDFTNATCVISPV